MRRNRRRKNDWFLLSHRVLLKLNILICLVIYSGHLEEKIILKLQENLGCFEAVLYFSILPQRVVP